MAAPQAQQPLQAGIKIEKSLQDVIDLNGGDKWWGGLNEQDKGEIVDQYRSKYLDPQLESLPEPDRNEILGQFNQKYGLSQPQQPQELTPQQGLQNLFNTYQQGVNNFGDAVLNPQTYAGLAQQAGNAAVTEFQNRIKPPENIQDAIFKGVNSTPLSFAPGAISAVRDLAQGALNLPADIANAYQGRVEYQPAVQLPEVFQDYRQQFPVTSFLGEQVPYAIPFGKAAQASKLGKLGEIGKAAAEGAAIGGILDSQGQGLQGRVNNALMGGALPAVLGGASGAVAKFTKPKAQFTPKVSGPSEGMQAWLKAQNAAEMAARAEQQALQEQLQRIGNTQKLTPEGTQQSQLSQFDNLYAQLSREVADRTQTPQNRAVYSQYQGRIREQARPLQEAKAQASAEKTKASEAKYQRRRSDRLSDSMTKASYNAQLKGELANQKGALKLQEIEAKQLSAQAVLNDRTASQAKKDAAKQTLTETKLQLEQLKGQNTTAKLQGQVQLSDTKAANKIKTLEAQIAGRERVINSKTASAKEIAQARKDLETHKAQLRETLQEQSYRNKQALQTQKPAPKQRGQAAKNAAPAQAKPGGRTVLNPAKKAGNVERIQREKALPGYDAVKGHVEVQRRPEIIKKAEQSYLKNEKVKLDYMAEKAGTEIDKPTSDGVVITGIKQAKDKSVFLTAIDSEGQFRSYKLFDGKGDSLINDIKPTGKKADFELVRDLEDMTKANTGRQRVLNTKTNELTEIFKPGETAKSSEIAAAREKIMDVAERLKSGEKVSTREIVDTAKRVDQDTFKKQFENLTQEQINQIGKDLGC